MASARKIFFLLFFFALCAVGVLVTYWSRERTPPAPARDLFALVNGQL